MQEGDNRVRIECLFKFNNKHERKRFTIEKSTTVYQFKKNVIRKMDCYLSIQDIRLKNNQIILDSIDSLKQGGSYPIVCINELSESERLQLGFTNQIKNQSQLLANQFNNTLKVFGKKKFSQQLAQKIKKIGTIEIGAGIQGLFGLLTKNTSHQISVNPNNKIKEYVPKQIETNNASTANNILTLQKLQSYEKISVQPNTTVKEMNQQLQYKIKEYNRKVKQLERTLPESESDEYTIECLNNLKKFKISLEQDIKTYHIFKKNLQLAKTKS